MTSWLQDWREKISVPVFALAASFNVSIILFGSLWPDTAGRVFDATLAFITKFFGWYYIAVVSLLLVFVIWLGFSRFGRIRLGPPDSRPDFGYFSWFAMLFAAGMGMGLVFWGVAEPLMH